MKKINLILLLALIFLLTGCTEKTIKTMDSNSKQEMMDYFINDYKENFSYVNHLSTFFLEPGHEYYDQETLKVELLNQYTYYSESGIFEINCYYDKEAKKWQYLGYNSFKLDKKLDILGEWEFQVFPGFFNQTSHYVARMDIKEIRNNQVLIGMSVNTGSKEITVEEKWYELYFVGPTKLNHECYKIYGVMTVPKESKRYKDNKYNFTFFYDDKIAQSESFYETSGMNRLSTYGRYNDVD